MVKDKRTDFNYFGMKPLEPGRASPFMLISVFAILISIFAIPAILNSEFGISPGILLVIYIAVLEVLFIGVCLFTKFELSPKNVVLIKAVLLPFALLLSPLLLLLYYGIVLHFQEILDFILSVLKIFGICIAAIIGIAAVIYFFIYCNVAIAEAFGQKPKKEKK